MQLVESRDVTNTSPARKLSCLRTGGLTARALAPCAAV